MSPAPVSTWPKAHSWTHTGCSSALQGINPGGGAGEGLGTVGTWGLSPPSARYPHETPRSVGTAALGCSWHPVLQPRAGSRGGNTRSKTPAGQQRRMWVLNIHQRRGFYWNRPLGGNAQFAACSW